MFMCGLVRSREPTYPINDTHGKPRSTNGVYTADISKSLRKHTPSGLCEENGLRGL